MMEHVERLSLTRALRALCFARLHYRATDTTGATNWHTEYYAGSTRAEATSRAYRAGVRRLSSPSQADNEETARVRPAEAAEIPLERLRELLIRHKKRLLGVPERVEPVAQTFRIPSAPVQPKLNWSDLKV